MKRTLLAPLLLAFNAGARLSPRAVPADILQLVQTNGSLYVSLIFQIASTANDDGGLLPAPILTFPLLLACPTTRNSDQPP